MAAAWRIREDGAGLGSRTAAGQPAWPGWGRTRCRTGREPAATTCESSTASCMSRPPSTGLAYGHFGEGCLHVRIDFPSTAKSAAMLPRVRRWPRPSPGGYGGSMSGRARCGRARSELLQPTCIHLRPLRLSPRSRRSSTPTNRLNPGVIVAPASLDADLRGGRAATGQSCRPRLRAHPHDGRRSVPGGAPLREVGKCRAPDTTARRGDVPDLSWPPATRRRTPARGRARVLQELANGSLVKGFASAEVAEAMDLCLSCKGCSADCPTGVDMATYKAEALYQRYRRRPRPAAHYALGYAPVGPAGSLVRRGWPMRPCAIRAWLPAGQDAWAASMSAARAELAVGTFRQWFAKRDAPATGTPVMLWVDTLQRALQPRGRAGRRGRPRRVGRLQGADSIEATVAG